MYYLTYSFCTTQPNTLHSSFYLLCPTMSWLCILHYMTFLLVIDFCLPNLEHVSCTTNFYLGFTMTYSAKIHLSYFALHFFEDLHCTTKLFPKSLTAAYLFLEHLFWTTSDLVVYKMTYCAKCNFNYFALLFCEGIICPTPLCFYKIAVQNNNNYSLVVHYEW